MTERKPGAPSATKEPTGKPSQAVKVSDAMTVYANMRIPELLAEKALLKAEDVRLREALNGCTSMLNESAKQFRNLGDYGHAGMCERHIQAARAALNRDETEKEPNPCPLFAPMVSEIFGPTDRCKNCSKLEAEHNQ